MLALLGADGGAGAPARPHDDPQPARRIARRILQRLNGMGKWGGYHTDFRHLARGFAGNERALADDVGEALLDAGLLDEKPSVGQRHVYLNPRRAADIHALIERGDRAAGPAACLAELPRRPVAASDDPVRRRATRSSTLVESAACPRRARPDRLVRVGLTLHRWGPTLAAGDTPRRFATRTTSRSSTSSAR